MENNEEILMEGVKALADAVEPALDSAAGTVADVVVEPVVKAAKKAARRTKTAAKRGRKVVEEVAKTTADAAAKTADAAVKAAAKATPMKPELYVQYDFNQVDISGVVDAAKAAFKAKHSRVAVKSCKIYIKPQERAAYYVINDDFTGKLDL